MGLLCMDEYLDEQLIPAKLIYYPDETTQIPAHWHNNLELNYVDSGTLTLLEDGQKFTLGPGDVRFINSGVVHKMNAQSALGITLVFSNGFINKICSDAGQILFDWDACPERQAELRKAILPIYQISQKLFLTGQKLEDQPYTYLMVNSHLYHIAYLMMQYFAGKRQNRHRIQKSNFHIRQAVHYIDLHYKENLSASEVAEQVGLSREHFSRIFREFTGMTFTQFLTNLRLAVAYRQLVTTELSTLEIALSAGFPDAKSFSRHFKVRYGCPPGKYRKLRNQKRNITK